MLDFGAFLYDFRDGRSEVHEREYDFENLLGCYKSVLILTSYKRNSRFFEIL